MNSVAITAIEMLSVLCPGQS